MTITEFIQYLEAEHKTCTAQAETLAADDRRDEANMQKIRANIFDVFTVVSKTAEKRFPQNPLGFIKERIETIPTAWKQSLAAAEERNEYNKAATERIKLQAMDEIRQKFNDVARESE